MNDRREELIRRAAALKAESAELKAVSQGLVGQLAEARKAGDRVIQEPEEQRSAPAAARDAYPARPRPQQMPVLPASGASRGPGTPGAGRAGRVPVARLGPWPGTGILDEDEAVALTVLLEELAARLGLDPLRGPAMQAAALLRRRVAAGQRGGSWLGGDGPTSRRDTGDTRDDAAGHRDTQAAQRDRSAVERDDQATERDRQADAADQRAVTTEQHMRDRLWAAELRDHIAAERAATQPPPSYDAGRQLDLEGAEADGALAGEDRQAVQEILAQARIARQAALHERYAAGHDRMAAHRDRDAARADRQAADLDRQAARADRDQTVIDSEEEAPTQATGRRADGAPSALTHPPGARPADP